MVTERVRNRYNEKYYSSENTAKIKSEYFARVFGENEKWLPLFLFLVECASLNYRSTPHPLSTPSHPPSPINIPQFRKGIARIRHHRIGETRQAGHGHIRHLLLARDRGEFERRPRRVVHLSNGMRVAGMWDGEWE